MLDLAEGDIIDKVVDLTDERQLTDFVSRLKQISNEITPKGKSR
jgi:hypothetical protein